MESRRRACFALAAALPWAALILLACGARTALDPPIHDEDASVPGVDAGLDSPFFGFDVFNSFPDARRHRGFPVDAIAPEDVHVALDSPLACPDGELPTAYLFAGGGELYTFDPATLGYRPLGRPDCRTRASAWTLSVSSRGVAYLEFAEPWAIYKVDLATLRCAATPFVVGQLGIENGFNIAVSRTVGLETLYLSAAPHDDGRPILAEMDPVSFVLTEVGPLLPVPPDYAMDGADMQGDPLGHLFNYLPNGLVFEVDSATGAVIGKTQTGFASSGDWAVMTYENAVYLFAVPQGGGGSSVARYDIGTRGVTVLGSLPFEVVGASAVPCLKGG